MKRIEDAPKELQDCFKLFLEKWPMPPDRDTEHSFRLAVEHFFLLGFDIAMATGGMKPEKPKRTVSRIMNIDGQVYVTSSDGKAFVLQGRPEQWRSLPDLPQD